jgi:hypothetical protein
VTPETRWNEAVSKAEALLSKLEDRVNDLYARHIPQT